MQLDQHLTNADAYPQFIVSKIDIQADGTVKKIPCNPQGITSDHKNPTNWMTQREAQLRVDALGSNYRLGFSITAECGYSYSIRRRINFYECENASGGS